MARTIKEIIVHCTATPEGRPVTVKEVDKWHRERGFACIGYHYLIGLNGEICQGRNVESVGAHCEGHNANSIGVCYVGGLSLPNPSKGGAMDAKDTRTAAQKETLAGLIRDLKRQYPGATVHGHREFANKDCPCFDAKAEYLGL
jgi:N-acetylmuramoyl-L-alanine amidase